VFVLEIEVRERLPSGVADDEAGVVVFFERPRWWEAAGRQKAKANAATKRMPHPMTRMGTGS